MRAATAVAATTKGSRADNSWEESEEGISEMGPELIPKERMETLPSRLGNPTRPTKEGAEQEKTKARWGDLAVVLMAGMDREVGKVEKMGGLGFEGRWGRERNREVAAMEVFLHGGRRKKESGKIYIGRGWKV